MVITDENNSPRPVLDADKLLRHALFRPERTNPGTFCHRPVVIRDSTERIGDVIPKLRLDPEYTEDSVITDDVILL